MRELERQRERETDLLGIRAFDGALRCAVVFPNTYHVGMSSLGVHAIYRLLNALPQVSCERAFLPDARRLAEHRRTGAVLRSVETQTALSEFDVLGFSVPFEGDYTNVLRVLALGRVPPTWAERNDFHPLVLAGGPAMTFNPLPLSAFVDAFAIGEGESLCYAIADALLDTWAGRRGSTRADYRTAALGALAQTPGVWVPRLLDPSSGGRVQRQVLWNLGQAAESAVLTPETEFSDAFLIEVGRGCGRGCRFCVGGHICRPPRFRDQEDILSRARRALRHTRRVGLVGPAVSDHPAMAEIVGALAAEGAAVSVSSVRADRMDDRLAAALAAGGSQTVTVAPEAGTERLRMVANKGLSDEEILGAVESLARSDIRRVKLYFLYGLPTETDEDVAEIAALCRRLRAMAPGIELALSVTPLIPKPFTPWQWEPMADLATLDRRRALLEELLPAEVTSATSFESARHAAIQALLARGGPELGPVLLRVADTGESASDWQSVLGEHRVSLDEEVFRRRAFGEPLPWGFLDMGVPPEFLWAERVRSLVGEMTPPCQPGACDRCAACALGGPQVAAVEQPR
jgi:radical SAM superfamily enzyme YgiQ (UPF0313 family)